MKLEKKALSDRERSFKKTTLSLNEKLVTLLDKYLARLPRTRKILGQSHVITEVMGRYDTLMRIERRALRDMFSEGEIAPMLNNALSTIYDAATIPGAVLADTEDEIDATFKFYGVDRASLLAKLKALTPGQQFALVDWLEEMRADIGEK